MVCGGQHLVPGDKRGAPHDADEIQLRAKAVHCRVKGEELRCPAPLYRAVPSRPSVLSRPCGTSAWCMRRSHSTNTRLALLPMVKQLHDVRDAVAVRKEALGALTVLARDTFENQDEDVNSNVKDILENGSDDNVLIMTEANLMWPLANRLVEGSIGSRIVMAKALAAMHLPDSSKTSLATEDVDGPRSTRLSSVKTVEEIKVGAARILADLSKIAGDAWSGEDEATTNQLEVYIYKFLQLMGSLTPVGVQSYVLSTFLGLANGKNIGAFTRAKLCEHKALQILLPLLKNPASTPSSAAPTTPAMVADVRRHAMELFCLLSKESSQEASVAMRERPEIMADLVKNLCGENVNTGDHRSMEDGVVRSALDHHQQDGGKSLLHVVAALVVEASQEATTVEVAVGIVLKFAKLGVETDLAESDLNRYGPPPASKAASLPLLANPRLDNAHKNGLIEKIIGNTM
ncbi:hypothetical protein SELMODRAFT_424553 [Selaginella moellendorffii]|uniref:Uncharacterized protein n=1 Tax=Selaginella moellendorffii TaxID=88036 RepID=D8SQA2_SELML|nr:hypothetical protein SELMODRAFT_424553 [Selaginella moellendorffii]